MYESNHSKISHEHEGNLLVLHLKDSISDDNALKSELLHLASHARKTGVKKIMIKNESLGHPVSSEVQEWAKGSVELPLLANGVDKIAIVNPNDERIFSLIHRNDTARKRYFSSEDEARTWLG